MTMFAGKAAGFLRYSGAYLSSHLRLGRYGSCGSK